MSSSQRWPQDRSYAERFCVRDLIPGGQIKVVFVGESPHRDEVAPESANDRTPFRGVAGREWWSEIARILGSDVPVRPVPGRQELEKLCGGLQIAVLNAVQYPLDPKITLHQGEACQPYRALGFEKTSGATGYKAVFKVKDGPVASAIADLAQRLNALNRAPGFRVVALGGDSRWFVERALEFLDFKVAVESIPHPSSWWRNRSYRERAVSALEMLVPRD